MRRAIVTFIMKLLFMNNYHVSKNPAKKVNREKKEVKEEPLQKSYESPLSDNDRKEIAAEICKELDETGVSEGGRISK